MKYCCFSSVVEHFLGKEEVTSSSLVNSSTKQCPQAYIGVIFMGNRYLTVSLFFSKERKK